MSTNQHFAIWRQSIYISTVYLSTVYSYTPPKNQSAHKFTPAHGKKGDRDTGCFAMALGGGIKCKICFGCLRMIICGPWKKRLLEFRYAGPKGRVQNMLDCSDFLEVVCGRSPVTLGRIWRIKGVALSDKMSSEHLEIWNSPAPGSLNQLLTNRGIALYSK